MNFEKHIGYGENFREPSANSTVSHRAAPEELLVTFDEYLSTLAAMPLAPRSGGDRGCADRRHFGRLAGFINQKKERRLQKRISLVRQAAQQRRVRLLNSERVSSTAGGSEARTPFAPRFARVGVASGD